MVHLRIVAGAVVGQGAVVCWTDCGRLVRTPGLWSRLYYLGGQRRQKLMLYGASDLRESYNSFPPSSVYSRVRIQIFLHMQSRYPLNDFFFSVPQCKQVCIRAPQWYPSLM